MGKIPPFGGEKIYDGGGHVGFLPASIDCADGVLDGLSFSPLAARNGRASQIARFFISPADFIWHSQGSGNGGFGRVDFSNRHVALFRHKPILPNA